MEMESLPTIEESDPGLPGDLELGAFSVSLAVNDLSASRAFYEHLGFVAVADSSAHGYLIMQNGTTTIGLFEQMFDSNILTFNPGLTNRMERIERFTDVREIQQRLTDTGITPTTPIADDAGESGAASFTVVDPDGNHILIDQFFPS